MDKRTKARVRRTVHKSERDLGRQTNDPRTYKPPRGGLVLFVLQADLTADSWVYGRRRRWANPRDPDDLTWATDTNDVRIYPWKLSETQQIDSGREVWCESIQGRWTAIVPEECLDERP